MGLGSLIERVEVALWSVPLIGRLAQRRSSQRFARNFDEAGMASGRYVPGSSRTLRSASDDQMHAMLAGDVATAAERIALEREMRRRDAWAAPAGRAYWISVAALVVSIAALAVSAAGKL